MIRPPVARRPITTIIGASLVESAFGIFVNGITGVFIGMTVLYVTIKLIALAAKERPETEKAD